ncbi:hypothetical protein JANAI62_03000 [Jannaschia pagri]|uniref:Signal peptidase I n=1 Tax=Jannaschia pagri TaxID=2829797 RepID=A0ABQ4NGY4_9RHOB|nr:MULTISPECIES: signal peptidase I [unclassified Jannaschia]GIT90217.1 hypothetical protein JANAI61_06750 [Jannaschia sp. AI_61]GIT93677.1 hypothetical protein JANAI62_03000 [Jannaschia sp. AI_62]
MTPHIGLSGTGSRVSLLVWTLCFQVIALLLATSGSLETAPLWVRLALYLIFGLSAACWFTAVVRRLHDMGRSGWFAALFAVPVIGLGMLIWALLAAPRPVDPDRFRPAGRYVVGTGLLIVMVLLVATRALWSPLRMTSAHMEPTLPAEAVFLAFDSIGGEVTSGDLVTYQFADNGNELALNIARAVAFGGQTVAFRDGVPIIDGVPARHERCPDDACTTEVLPSGARYGILQSGASDLDNIAPVQVPDGTLYILGDNRAVASDSRRSLADGGRGFIPAEAVRGRVMLFAKGTQP